MFAIISTGGKQYKVSPNDIINIEKLSCKAGEKQSVDVVAVFNDKSELISTKSTAEVEVIAEVKDNKKFTFKKERRTTHKKKTGHRQKLYQVKVLSIKH